MGKGMSYKFQKMFDERRLLKIKTDKKLVLEEFKAAELDLEDAKESFERKKFKWATIQGYYSMFHLVRGLVYSKGFREKSHYALLVAFREFFPEMKKLSKEFEDSMYLRQEADYGLKFSKTGALDVIENAEKFFVEIKKKKLI